MNRRNTAKLFRDFPDLYGDHRRPYVGSMGFGFQCGDGWFNLLYELSTKIEDELRRNPSGKTETYAIAEVKEKFGELRCYQVHGTHETSRLILEAKWQSRTVCELCGKPGKLRRGMRDKTLCDLCEQRME